MPRLLFFYSQLLALLCAAVQLSHCQHVEAFIEEMKSREAYLTAVQENPGILSEVTKAMDSLGDLWTVYMPELLGNSTISQPCSDSAVSIVDESIEWYHNHTTLLPKIAVLLDATGKPGAGLLGGNLFLVPSFDECFKYNYTSFCMGPVRLTALSEDSLFIWNVGLCVPKYCNATDVALIMNSTNQFSVSDKFMKCTDEKKPSFSPGAIIMIAVCVIFAVLVCLSTAIDWLFQKVNAPSGTNKTLEVNNSNGLPDEKIPLLTHTTVQRPQRAEKVLRFLTAFSLFKTIPTLFATKQAPSVITSLNGMRVISMFWVIMGHTHIGVFHGNGGTTDNALELKTMAARFSYQPIINTFPSVDTFFFLSGVLVAYLTFRHMSKSGRFPFIHYYAHRYLRLTPVYAFVIFFYWLITNHLTTGPTFALASENACAKYWWSNLLYISNFYPWKLKEECLPWSWYLANDMQFYVISPLMLIPLYFLFPLGLVVAMILLVSGFAITGSLVGVYDFQASLFTPFAYNYTPSLDPAVSDMLYVKPYARISPYIVGILLGYLFYKGVRLPFGRFWNQLTYFTMWVASGLILVPTLYGLYFIWHGHELTRVENILYITFSRFSWAVGLALIVFACHNGYGGYINTFLSLKIWTPLARMTYNAYLVHLIIIRVFYGQIQSAIHLTDFTMAVYTVAIVVLAYAVAAVVCVCVEFPLGTLELLVFEMVGLGGRGVTQRQGRVN
jgi:peptidoglycan/LPS O-acetylase OafA/YrhL